MAFLLFAKRFDNKYGKRLIDTATKTEEIDVVKTAFKRVVEKPQKLQEEI